MTRSASWPVFDDVVADGHGGARLSAAAVDFITRRYFTGGSRSGRFRDAAPRRRRSRDQLSAVAFSHEQIKERADELAKDWRRRDQRTDGSQWMEPDPDREHELFDARVAAVFGPDRPL